MRSEWAHLREAKARSLRTGLMYQSSWIFFKCSGFRHGEILSLRTHLVTSGDNFHCHNPERSSADIQWVEVKDTIKHPALRRTAPSGWPLNLQGPGEKMAFDLTYTNQGFLWLGVYKCPIICVFVCFMLISPFQCLEQIQPVRKSCFLVLGP